MAVKTPKLQSPSGLREQDKDNGDMGDNVNSDSDSYVDVETVDDDDVETVDDVDVETVDDDDVEGLHWGLADEHPDFWRCDDDISKLDLKEEDRDSGIDETTSADGSREVDTFYPEGITTYTEYAESILSGFAPEVNSIFVREVSRVSCILTLCGRSRTFLEEILSRTGNGEALRATQPFKSRTIMLFQKHGQKMVAFFILYFQEYGPDCPLPNRNKIYICLIDSVRLFEPANKRQAVHYCALLSYLVDAGRRGFTSAFLWVCPPPDTPKNGERTEYVFKGRPTSQVDLGPKQLAGWYKKFLRTAKMAGCIRTFSSLLEWVKREKEFFPNFPLFHEDHWSKRLGDLLMDFESHATRRTGQGKKRKVMKTARSIAVSVCDQASFLEEKFLNELKETEESFLAIELETPERLSLVQNDGESFSPLFGFRDNCIEFQTRNKLSFQNISAATEATSKMMAALRLETPRVVCDVCLKVMTKGTSCPYCDFDICLICPEVHHECLVDWQTEKDDDDDSCLEEDITFKEVMNAWKRMKKEWWPKFKINCREGKPESPDRLIVAHMMICQETTKCSGCKAWSRISTHEIICSDASTETTVKRKRVEDAEPDDKIPCESPEFVRFQETAADAWGT